MIQYNVSHELFYKIAGIAYLYFKKPNNTTFEHDVKIYLKELYNLNFVYVYDEKIKNYGYIEFNNEKQVTLFLLQL